MYLVEYSFDGEQWEYFSEWDSLAAANAEIDDLTWDNPAIFYRISVVD